jgi:A/G-specific adenine glycosylase
MREMAHPADLLNWYDNHAREMPWRIGPALRTAGVLPDPYRIWLSEVMLQQTTVISVIPYFERFTARWPTVVDLAAAEDAQVMGEWAGLGYYARARNALKCARAVVEHHAGQFPDQREALLKLPGIGPYTAAAIAAIAFDRPEVVVDGNVERVMARLHNDPTPLPQAKTVFTGTAAALTPNHRPGDYAQAIMDLGATICTPKSPSCGICPWHLPCRARAAGTQAGLPRKSPKKPKPTRRGIAYVVRRCDGALLLERRPDKGLLGGMLGWPGSAWNDAPAPAPPLTAEWRLMPEEVLHTFTHFHLQLRIMVAHVGFDALPLTGEFTHYHNFNLSDLPTIMRKVFDLSHDALENMIYD